MRLRPGRNALVPPLVGGAILLLMALLPTARVGAADAWLPVRDTSLALQPGSPLDFSSLLPNPVIGPGNFLTIGAGGHIAYSAAPDEPARLLCASLAWSPDSGGFPDRAQADLYARQLAMHGYNIARFHFVEANLMFGRAKDFDFDPVTLDRFRYLMAALKRNGISWIMDGVTSTRAAYGGFDDRWDMNGTMKTDLYVDEKAVAHWTQLQQKLLGTVNPYTGLAPLADPALALIILANENGIEFDTWLYDKAGRPPYDRRLTVPFNAWLKARYGTTEALRSAWGRVPAGQSIVAGNLQLPPTRYEQGPRMRDFEAFVVDIEQRTAARLSAALRDMGYRGLISDYNNFATIQTGLTRASLDVVTMNTYQGFVPSFVPGASLEQKSAIADGAGYVREAAASRWLGKPFLLTEWDQLYWNRYRYEAGLMMPAYAALQGWDGICRHASGPIALRYGEPFPQKQTILPYITALDPVARAGETLAALLFRRGDVAEAKIEVPFAVTGPADLGDNLEAREPKDLTTLALVGKIGLEAAHEIGDPVSVPQPRTATSFGDLLGRLEAAGLMPPDSGTASARGSYTSATDEIRLDQTSLQMRVVTPVSVGAAFAAIHQPVALGPLTITSSTGPALFAVSSLDGAPVAESRRLLVVFATDARGSGMRFADSGETVIADYGHLPVVIRHGEVAFSLTGRGAWRIAPVGLDGAVHAPVAHGTGAIQTTLSNATPEGPTTYFLIER